MFFQLSISFWQAVLLVGHGQECGTRDLIDQRSLTFMIGNYTPPSYEFIQSHYYHYLFTICLGERILIDLELY